MKAVASRVVEFGDFRLELGERRLFRRDGTEVMLTPRVFETLRYLVEHSGRVLDKELIMEAVWPDCIVEENNLAQNISTLRRIFGDTPGAQKYIVTVPARGYRFVPEIRPAQTGIESARPKPSATKPSLAEDILPRDLPAKRERPSPFLLTGIALLAISAAVFVFWRTSWPHFIQKAEEKTAASSTIPEKSIAVLPFENLSDDKQNAYFTAGVQDEILSNLASVADLKVISRTSANHYQSGNPRNSREIGQQLGVAHLLEGSVQRVGDRVRIHAQLIDTRSDTHTWAQTYEREAADVFAIQVEIARSIADQLQAKISLPERTAIAQSPTTDFMANELYAQARKLEFNYPDYQSLLEAVRLINEAVGRDPRFLLAYCTLARLHLDLYNAGYDHTPARLEQANAAIQNAVRIQPEAGEVHRALGMYAYWGFLDFDRARAELDLARRTLPNDAELCFVLGLIDRRQGRWTEATRNLDRAVELDPRNMRFLISAGATYEVLRRYSESSRLYDRAVALAPHNWNARVSRASQVFSERADTSPLRNELSAVLVEQPTAIEHFLDLFFQCAMAERDFAAVNRGLALMRADGLAGRDGLLYPRAWFGGLAARAFNDTAAAQTSFAAARATVEKIVREQPDNAPACSLLGQIDAALGRKDEAVREGRRACELHPASTDALVWPGLITNLAMIYAWTGDTDAALEQLALSARLPRGVTYGGLKLDPQWDSLRGDPRFEKIVASLAPKR